MRSNKSKSRFLMSSQSLTSFEIQKYFEMNLNLMVFVQEIIFLK